MSKNCGILNGTRRKLKNNVLREKDKNKTLKGTEPSRFLTFAAQISQIKKVSGF